MTELRCRTMKSLIWGCCVVIAGLAPSGCKKDSTAPNLTTCDAFKSWYGTWDGQLEVQKCSTNEVLLTDTVHEVICGTIQDGLSDGTFETFTVTECSDTKIAGSFTETLGSGQPATGTFEQTRTGNDLASTMTVTSATSCTQVIVHAHRTSMSIEGCGQAAEGNLPFATLVR